MFGADKGQHFNRKQIEFIDHGNREVLLPEIANVTGSAFPNTYTRHLMSNIHHPLMICRGTEGAVSRERREVGEGAPNSVHNLLIFRDLTPERPTFKTSIPTSKYL